MQHALRDEKRRAATVVRAEIHTGRFLTRQEK